MNITKNGTFKYFKGMIYTRDKTTHSKRYIGVLLTCPYYGEAFVPLFVTKAPTSNLDHFLKSLLRQSPHMQV